MNPRYHIGIDPGTKTGYAVWDSEEMKYFNVMTTTFWECVDFTYPRFNPKNTAIIIEIPGRFLYSRNKTGSRKTELNVAHKAGGTYREAILLAERFESLGFKVIRVKPTKRKLTAEQFKKVTGYTGRTSEHGRDAAMLVFGK